MRVKPRTIILMLKRNKYTVAQTACELGIHRSTVYRWMRRSRTPHRYTTVFRCNNLKRRSTRPLTIHCVLTQKQETAILFLREATGYDAHKLTHMLKLAVSPRTVHRFLQRKMAIRDYGHHRRPRFQNTIHMHVKNTKTIGYLQMDVKYITPELSGLPWTCFEYAIIDIFSRYKEAVILNHLDQDGAIAALLEILPRLPFKPVSLQTDNGLEFQQRFKQHVEALKMRYHYIHKSTPNENAVIERSFRTDEEEFFFRLKDRPKHYDDLREQFARYLHQYNHIRPHHGINLQTPIEVVANVMSH